MSNFSDARYTILHGIAIRLNKSVQELKAHIDYDPIAIDERAYKMVQESRGVYSNWTGD